MTSPILLGVTQMSERVLGSNYIQEPGGGWGGTFGAGSQVGLKGVGLTVANPNGATVVGAVDLTCYTTIPGSLIQGSTWIDANAQTVWGLFYFNLASTHTIFRYCFSHFVGPGAHTVSMGIWVAAGNAIFDTVDGGTFAVWERI